MKVAVIGGGASGMMCAIFLAKNGQDVVLLEKNNSLGKKLLITGKGRCNVTNATTGEEFLKNVVHGAKFLISGERAFNSGDTIAFFENAGVKLKVERGKRVFPESDNAQTILNALIYALKKYKVKVRLNSNVQDIVAKDGKVCGVMVNNQNETFDAVVVATGGLSYKTTGSSGDGLVFAQKTGHKIVEPKPALNGIRVLDKDIADLAGVSLKNVKIRAKHKEKTIYESEIGEMLFTHVGVSGPIVLTASSFINRENVDKIEIDFKPALSCELLLNKINNIIKESPTKTLSGLLAVLLPKALTAVFASRLNLEPEFKINQLSAQNRKNLVALLKGLGLAFGGVEDLEYSVITSGGVSLNEVSPKDMQSKLVSGLFFIGEVLDLDALTGGFNLQIAFTTAVACANSNFFKGER